MGSGSLIFWVGKSGDAGMGCMVTCWHGYYVMWWWWEEEEEEQEEEEGRLEWPHSGSLRCT